MTESSKKYDVFEKNTVCFQEAGQKKDTNVKNKENQRERKGNTEHRRKERKKEN